MPHQSPELQGRSTDLERQSRNKASKKSQAQVILRQGDLLRRSETATLSPETAALYKAVVIGGSFASVFSVIALLTTGYGEVTVLERNVSNPGEEGWKDAPQGAQPHAFTERLLDELITLFPDFLSELENAGGKVVSIGGSDSLIFLEGKPLRTDTGVKTLCINREWLLAYLWSKAREMGGNRLHFKLIQDVKDVETLSSGTQTPQAILTYQAKMTGSLDSQNLQYEKADVIINATGRSNPLIPKLFKKNDLELPQGAEVNAHVLYSTITIPGELIDPPVDPKTGATRAVVPALTIRAEEDPRKKYRQDVAQGVSQPTQQLYPSGAALSLLGNGPDGKPQYMLAVMQMGVTKEGQAKVTPHTVKQFAQLLKNVDSTIYAMSERTLHSIIAQESRGKKSIPVQNFLGGNSVLHHYEDAKQWPWPLYPAGDTRGFLNPRYGQGITAAYLESLVLKHSLEHQLQPLEHMQLVRQVLQPSWWLATTADSRLASTTSENHRFSPLQLKLMPLLFELGMELQHHSSFLASAFFGLANMRDKQRSKVLKQRRKS